MFKNPSRNLFVADSHSAIFCLRDSCVGGQTLRHSYNQCFKLLLKGKIFKNLIQFAFHAVYFEQFAVHYKSAMFFEKDYCIHTVSTRLSELFLETRLDPGKINRQASRGKSCCVCPCVREVAKTPKRYGSSAFSCCRLSIVYTGGKFNIAVWFLPTSNAQSTCRLSAWIEYSRYACLTLDKKLKSFFFKVSFISTLHVNVHRDFKSYNIDGGLNHIIIIIIIIIHYQYIVSQSNFGPRLKWPLLFPQHPYPDDK